MKRFAGLVISSCLLSAPALAKDVCILHGIGVGIVGAEIVFSRLKIPTKLGTSAPLTGFAVTPAIEGAIPVTGTIVRGLSGEVVVGLTISTGDTTCFERAIVDETLAGTGVLECSPTLSDVSVPWTPIDCSSLTSP